MDNILMYKTHQKIHFFLALILLCSGAAAIGAQIVWFRYLALILGSTLHSFSWVTSVFMIGMAFGAWASPLLFGKSSRHATFAYILVEFLLALSVSLSFYMAIKHQAMFFPLLDGPSFIGDAIVSIGLLGVPCVLMGMSFPLLIRIISQGTKNSFYYSLNTLGAAIGIICFGFIFLWSFGYIGIALLIPLVSILNICFMFFISNLLKGSTPKTLSHSKRTQELSKAVHPIKSPYVKLFLGALSGITLFALEVMWFRHLEIILGDRAYLHSFILFVIILTLGFAAYVSSWLCQLYDTLNVIKIATIAAVISIFISYTFIPEAFYSIEGLRHFEQTKILFILFSFLIPLFSIGVIFPSLLNEWGNSNLMNSAFVAKIMGVNTSLGALASLLASYVILPTFGINTIFTISLLGLSLILGTSLIISSKNISFARRSFEFSSFAAISLLTLFIHPPGLKVAPDELVVYQRETPEAHFTLIKRGNGHYEMYSGNYRIVARYNVENLRYVQTGLAAFPGLYHPSPQKILTIGLGYGISIDGFLGLEPERIDSVELLESVYEKTHYFSSLNNRFYEDPRVNTVIGDGRRFLNEANDRYDIISANVANPYGVMGHYFLTKEFYQQVLDKLAPGGIFSQFVWGESLTEILHTFSEIFPHVKTIVGYDESDLIIIGSKEPLTRKRELSSFDEWWPQFNHLTREDAIKKGEELLRDYLFRSPDFIVSDNRADMLFVRRPHMGLLWTYKQ